MLFGAQEGCAKLAKFEIFAKIATSYVVPFFAILLRALKIAGNRGKADYFMIFYKILDI